MKPSRIAQQIADLFETDLANGVEYKKAVKALRTRIEMAIADAKRQSRIKE